MSMWIVTLFVMLVVVGIMSVGVIFSNKPIKGSCGGLSSFGLEGGCEICGGDISKCEEESSKVIGVGSTAPESKPAKSFPANLAYDATKK